VLRADSGQPGLQQPLSLSSQGTLSYTGNGESNPAGSDLPHVRWSTSAGSRFSSALCRRRLCSRCCRPALKACSDPSSSCVRAEKCGLEAWRWPSRGYAASEAEYCRGAGGQTPARGDGEPPSSPDAPPQAAAAASDRGDQPPQPPPPPAAAAEDAEEELKPRGPAFSARSLSSARRTRRRGAGTSLTPLSTLPALSNSPPACAVTRAPRCSCDPAEEALRVAGPPTDGSARLRRQSLESWAAARPAASYRSRKVKQSTALYRRCAAAEPPAPTRGCDVPPTAAASMPRRPAPG